MSPTRVTATEFKAHCLRLMEEVRRSRRPVLITKRGKVVAQLAPPPEAGKPWLALRGSVRFAGDVLEPVVDEREIDCLR
jgi:prevent-host-death family protein